MPDLNKTENFIKAWGMLCKNHGCYNCPLNAANKYGMNCAEYIRSYFCEALEIVQKWSNDHLKKTRASVFLEALSSDTFNVKMSSTDSSIPHICTKGFFKDAQCELVNYDCTACWNVEVE